ncbi:MAG: flagellar basal body-associated FliL family protein [Pseudomonadota bacterium]
MADAAVEQAEEKPKKGSLKGILVGLVGAIVMGGAGFFATYTGLTDSLLKGGDAPKAAEKNFAFVPLEPLIVTLGPDARAATLKFTAQLEVEPGSEVVVGDLMPRIMDVLNNYLRAVDETELEDPASLTLLRAQMLRRLQIIVGDGHVRDLLIAEFILT